VVGQPSSEEGQLHIESYSSNHDSGIKYVEGVFQERSGLHLDYDIRKHGIHHVADGSVVLLMKIDETSRGIEDNIQRRVRGWLVLHSVHDNQIFYERIGILKLLRDEMTTQAMDVWYEMVPKSTVVNIV